jgi:Putative auto-transporter adhesin, head GIN domain
MIRTLIAVAVTGFIASLICLSVAAGIAGPDAITNGAWYFTHDGDGWWGGRHGFHIEDDGPQTTREIAWSGGDSLYVELPADVKYTQGSGPAKLVVTGPRDAVEDVEVEDGHVSFAHDHHHSAGLTIVMTAPSVTRFTLSGSGKLAIADYRQDTLAVDLSGDADMVAKGEAKAIDVDISGDAGADLGAVKAESATVRISGSGGATLAPSEQAKLDISGSGDVTLLTHPKSLETNVSGSGSVRQEDRPAPAPEPSPKPKVRART